MPPSRINSQLNYSSNLFKINDSRMIFYVYPSSDSNDIVQLIQEGGGLVVNDVDNKNRGAIYLSSNTKNLENRRNCICTSFIYACCLSNKILDLDEFRLELASNCCSRSPCEHLNRGNALGECLVQKGTFSSKYIRSTMKYMFRAESVWKTMAESKEFGDMSWRDIRSNFHLWAFLHLNTSAPEDSIFVRDDKCSSTKMANESSNGIETKKAFVAVCAERLSEENKNIEMEEDVTQTNLENRVLETVTEDVETTSDDHQSSCVIKIEGKSCNVASAKMLTELKIDDVMRENVTQSKLMIAVEGGKDISDDVSEDSAKLSYEMKAKEKASAERLTEDSRCEEMREDFTQSNLENNISVMAGNSREKIIGVVSKPEGWTYSEACEKDLEDVTTDEDIPQYSENRVTMDVKYVCSDFPEQTHNPLSEIMDKSSTSGCIENLAEENRDEEMRENVPITNLKNRTLEKASEDRKKISVDVSKPSHNFGIEAREKSPILIISVEDLESVSTDIVPQRTSKNTISVEMSNGKERIKSLNGGEACREVNAEKKDKDMDISIYGKWISVKKMNNFSSTSSMHRPISRDKNSQMTQVNLEISGSDGSDTDEANYAVPKHRKRKPVRLYTLKEDLEILRYAINRRKRIGTLAGNRMWKFMEKRNIVQDRTWQSLKERFKRHIMPNISSYPLSSEERRKLKN